MSMLLVLLQLLLTVNHCTATSYELLTDGGFDKIGTWNFTPATGLCHGWCHASNAWYESARSGSNFVLADPAQGSVALSQRISTTLEYNRCDFSAYLRIIDTVNANIAILWDSTQYTVDVMQWEKDHLNSPSEWTKSEVTLYGTGSELEIRLQTGGVAYISVDDVSLLCYTVQFYEEASVQWLIGIAILLIFTQCLAFWYFRCDIERILCCCCQNLRRPKFEPVVLEDFQDNSDDDQESGEKLPQPDTAALVEAIAQFHSVNSEGKSSSSDSTVVTNA